MSVAERFISGSPRRQFGIIAGLALVVCAVLVAAYFVWLRPSYKVLFTDLKTTDAATIVAALDVKHVPYRLQDSGATILVPANLVDSTRLQVMSTDLPLKGVVGFELFNKSDMGLTEFAQKINYQRALQGELERTIMTLDGVDSARVHLSLADETVFREDRRPPKASITIAMKPGGVLPADSVQGIQRLVAAAVPDLEVDNVVILDDHGRALGGPGPTAEAASVPDEKAATELYYSARVRRVLDLAFPTDQFAVTVTAVSAAASTSFDNWTPSTRSFGLKVSASLWPAAEPAAIDDIKTRIAGAIGLDARLGDSIELSTGVGPQVAAERPPRPIESLPSPANTIQKNNVSLALIISLGVAIALAGTFAIGRMPARTGRLNAEQRRGYARRLTSMLDEEDDSVASPV